MQSNFVIKTLNQLIWGSGPGRPWLNQMKAFKRRTGLGSSLPGLDVVSSHVGEALGKEVWATSLT